MTTSMLEMFDAAKEQSDVPADAMRQEVTAAESDTTDTGSSMLAMFDQARSTDEQRVEDGVDQGMPSKDSFRPDGSKKGNGYFGVLQRPDGMESTEISVGVNIGGKEMDIPTLVPTLTEEEKNYLLNMPMTEHPTRAIIQKAVTHAKKRMSQGLSVFKED